jgi:hypothetical protein
MLGYCVGKLVDNCCEIRLSAQDVQIFQLDNPNILLEVRPNQDEYGVYYTAKGRQWDIWCRADDGEGQGRIAFAVREPILAVRGLLGRRWRADFGFNPDEDD